MTRYKKNDPWKRHPNYRQKKADITDFRSSRERITSGQAQMLWTFIVAVVLIIVGLTHFRADIAELAKPTETKAEAPAESYSALKSGTTEAEESKIQPDTDLKPDEHTKAAIEPKVSQTSGV